MKKSKMSNTSDDSNNLFEENSEVTFEQSFKRLEDILDNLENNIKDYSLEEIIKNYQEGLKLLKVCRAKLSSAELRIEKIGTEEDN